jgi:hypothetical protein
MDTLQELALAFRRMSATIEDIKDKVYALKHPEENFMENKDFLKLMNVSKRTAQIWRDKELLDYYKVGSKIYYSTAQISKFLKKHEITAGNKDR